MFQTSVFLSLIFFFYPAATASSVPSQDRQWTRAAAPSYFEPNRGQAHREYAWIARTPSYSVLIRSNEATFLLPTPADDGHALEAVNLEFGGLTFAPLQG